MPVKDISPEMQELLDKVNCIREDLAALDSEYGRLALEEENTLLELQSICEHETVFGYESYTEGGIEYPGFKCCAICEKVL